MTAPGVSSATPLSIRPSADADVTDVQARAGAGSAPIAPPPAPGQMLGDLERPDRARWALRVMWGGLCLMVLWSAFAQIDQVTRAPAQLIVAARTQLIQSSDGGIVTQLHIKEGDQVKTGQLLATLQKERAQAAVADSSAKVAALRITLSRLEAEVYGKPLHFAPELL